MHDALVRITCAPATVYVESRLASSDAFINSIYAQTGSSLPKSKMNCCSRIVVFEVQNCDLPYAAAVISAATLDTKRIYDRPDAHSTSVNVYGKTQIHRIAESQHAK